MARKTIAQHIKTALAEDKFSDRFNGDAYLRLNFLDSTHLYYMEEHLQQTNRVARSALWKEANSNVLEKVSREINWRTKIIDAELREEEEEEERRFKKAELEELRKAEEERVMQSIIEHAKTRAAEEVSEAEKKRLAQERVRVMAQVKEADGRKDRLIQGAVAFLVVGVVLIAVLVHSPIFLSIGIAGVVLIAGAVLYRAYSITRIFPITKTKKELEAETNLRAEQLIEEALERLKREEEMYQERLRLERNERKQWRRQRKELERQEMERIAQRKIERQHLVASMLEKRKSDAADATDVISKLKANSAIVGAALPISTVTFLKQEKSQRALEIADRQVDLVRVEQMSATERKSQELPLPKRSNYTPNEKPNLDANNAIVKPIHASAILRISDVDRAALPEGEGGSQLNHGISRILNRPNAVADIENQE